MMSTATVTSNGQITIPDDVRTGLGLQAGDRIRFIFDDDLGRVVFLPAMKNIGSLKGIIDKPSQAVSLHDMKATVKTRGRRGSKR